MEIAFVIQDGRMQWPLTAAPRPAIVHFAAILVKYAMAVDNLHLYSIARDPPKRLANLLLRLMQGFDHSFSIVCIQRNSGLAMTAGAAAGADKYLGNKRHTQHLEKQKGADSGLFVTTLER